MQVISIPKMYPPEQYNLLGNTAVAVEIPDILAPTIKQITINPDPAAEEVYILQEEKDAWIDKKNVFHPATPRLYAIRKRGLTNFAREAGIKELSSEQVIPSTCRKCVAVNRYAGKVVRCGDCKNKDVAFRKTIAVPQLTGDVLTFFDTNEIIVENAIVGMSERQKAVFMRFLPEICEAKALNGAIRTALMVKNAYTLEELKKPFVVAYLIPNLNHEDVKRAAIENMFSSSATLFNTVPSVQHIESKVPEFGAIETSESTDYDKFVDNTYNLPEPKEEQPQPPSQPPSQQPSRPPQQTADNWADENVCSRCGQTISEKVKKYSTEKFGKQLCYKCQNALRGNS